MQNFLRLPSGLISGLCFLLLLSGCDSTDPDPDDGTRAEGFFSVEGTRIMGPDGAEFVARGVNLHGPGFGWPGAVPTYVDDIDEVWGFNAIRLNVVELERLYPEVFPRRQWQGQPLPFYAENGTVEELVPLYANREIVVMLDAHDKTGGWYTGEQLEKLVEWWTAMAERYKDNPYVWFNVLNEPGGSNSDSPGNQARWVAQHQQVIDAIRSTGADNIIVVDAYFWGQDVGEWNSSLVKESKSSILGLSDQLSDPAGNLVFSFHVYDQWRFGAQKMADYIDRVHARGISILVGEYGVGNAGGDTRDAVEQMFEVIVPRNLGRFVWAWWGGDSNDLTTSGNGGGQHLQTNANGEPTNLTWLGRQVWDDLRREE